MILNMSAQKKFDCSIIDSIPLIQKYPIWKKKDPFGREYYGVSNFWGMDASGCTIYGRTIMQNKSHKRGKPYDQYNLIQFGEDNNVVFLME